MRNSKLSKDLMSLKRLIFRVATSVDANLNGTFVSLKI